MSSDERALETFVMESVITGYHPGGTCRVGPANPRTVCDPSSEIVGLANAWVADASLMPELTRTDINLPAIVIAARIAAMLSGRPLEFKFYLFLRRRSALAGAMRAAKDSRRTANE